MDKIVRQWDLRGGATNADNRDNLRQDADKNDNLRHDDDKNDFLRHDNVNGVTNNNNNNNISHGKKEEEEEDDAVSPLISAPSSSKRGPQLWQKQMPSRVYSLSCCQSADWIAVG